MPASERPKSRSRSSLAGAAVERGALPLADRADRRAASRAGLALAPIDGALREEVAGLALGRGEVAQRRPAFLDRARERVAHGTCDAIPPPRRDAPGGRARIDLRAEQSFRRVD